MFCPHCGSQNITEAAVDWAIWSTQDHDNVDIVPENECRDCSLSFWCAGKGPQTPWDQRVHDFRHQLVDFFIHLARKAI